MHNNNPSPVQDGQGSIGFDQLESDISNRFQTVESHLFDINRDFLHSHRIIAGLDSCEYVDAFKVLRTRVLQKMRERGWNTLAVVSANDKAGTTVSAINLAISLALEVNQTVVLVDANLRNPGVHRYLGIVPKHGLADHLLDNVPIKNLVVHPRGIGQFMIIPGSRPLVNSAEMLSSPQMASLAESLKKHDTARLIIYDLPHLKTADALAFIPLVDAVLLVIEAGVTTQADLRQAIEHLRGFQIIGTLLNKSESLYGD
jgi:protein-tyrosine kinase